jgi:hypothetical protein
MNSCADRFRANSLLRSKDGTNSLLARNNSLLRCVGNSSANHCIRRCFRDGFSQKTAESAKFPAFFPATREFWPSGYCKIDPRQAAEEPTVGNGACSKNAHHAREHPGCSHTAVRSFESSCASAQGPKRRIEVRPPASDPVLIARPQKRRAAPRGTALPLSRPSRDRLRPRRYDVCYARKPCARTMVQVLRSSHGD